MKDTKGMKVKSFTPFMIVMLQATGASIDEVLAPDGRAL
jgi:hypothetical protein